MIPLEKQVCSLELAKELKELGVPQESLFYWTGHYIDTTDCVEQPETARVQLGDYGTEYMWKYSAFTCSELGELLPTFSDSKKLRSGWQSATPEPIKLFNAKTEVDARAKMLIHLIKSGTVKFGGK